MKMEQSLVSCIAPLLFGPSQTQENFRCLRKSLVFILNFQLISCKNGFSLMIKTSNVLWYNINCHDLNRFRLDRLCGIRVVQV